MLTERPTKRRRVKSKASAALSRARIAKDAGETRGARAMKKRQGADGEADHVDGIGADEGDEAEFASGIA